MKRTEMREQAFFLCFESLFDNGENINDLIDLYSENVEAVSEYAGDVFNGICNQKSELEEIINTYSKSWKVSRLPKTTLAILLVALYEMKNIESVPDSVAVNEAVELAKKYSTDADASFINGILGSYSRSK